MKHAPTRPHHTPKPTPNAVILPAHAPVTVAFNTGEIETIQLFDAGPAWSYTPADGLRVALRMLEHTP